MFISNKEKSQISEKFEQQKTQIEKLVKHIAKLQVDTQGADLTQIPVLIDSNKQVTKSYWAHIGKVKTLEKTISSLSSTNNMLRQNNEALLKTLAEIKSRLEILESRKPAGRPVGSKTKISISAEKVQELKDAGVWDDPVKRISYIDQFIKDEREKREEAQRQRNRESKRKFYLKKKAEKALQKELL
tara:strand:- start:283 stop:843 length:561 start_codon:yes stop_codon:yes gene_type:complete